MRNSYYSNKRQIAKWKDKKIITKWNLKSFEEENNFKEETRKKLNRTMKKKLSI